MTHKKPELFKSRSASQHFLFSKTDSKPKDKKEKDQLILDSKILSKSFPDILAGKSFIGHAMTALDSATKFTAMVIRIDNLKHKEKKATSNHAVDLLVDVAKAIDKLCQSENGIWGQLDQDIYGCFFSDKNEASAPKLSKKIQNTLGKLRKETVSIGAASYPTIDYNKEQIIDNARKALEHATFFGPGSSVSFDAVSLNISGDELYQKGDIDEAIEEFKTALLLDPSNVNVHNSLGVCYGVQRTYEKALEEFEEAIRLDPDEVMSIYNAGLVNMFTDKKDKALEYFLDADSKEECIFEVAIQTGKLYLEMRKPEKAKIFIEKAVRARPESGLACRFLGECCAAMNMTDDAVSAYKKAIRQNPNDADSLSALGYLYDLQGENPEITTIFCQQSVDIAPENGLFRYRLGSLYLKRDQLKDALEQLQKADALGHDCKDLIKKIKKLKAK
jgi:tetratricopeptide (TPR) repeat protein